MSTTQAVVEVSGVDFFFNVMLDEENQAAVVYDTSGAYLDQIPYDLDEARSAVMYRVENFCREYVRANVDV